MMKFILASLLLLLSAPAFAELKFYPLYHKSAVEIIPKIEPFLESGETVIAGHNELIIRMKSHNVADITRLIHSLDKPSHRLMIFVNRDGSVSRNNAGFNIDNEINIALSDTERNSSYEGTLTAGKNNTHANSSYNQKIQVLEGRPAFISQGVSHVIPGGHAHHYGVQGHYSGGAEYREITKGFYVTPQLVKDTVVLEISPWHDQPLSRNGRVAKVSRVSSVVRGKLNTWIELGGVSQSNNSSTSGLTGRHRQSTTARNKVWVKVIDLDAN